MKSSKRLNVPFIKYFTLLLCALILLSISGLSPQNVYAETVYKKITITSDRPLNQYTDIAAFLKGMKLTNIPVSARVSFKVFLRKSGSDQTITAGKAEIGEYELSFDIALKTDYYFDAWYNLQITFNGNPIDPKNLYQKYGDPSHNYWAQNASGFWLLDAHPVHKITFDAKGGTPAPATQWVVGDGQIKKPQPDPQKPGYQFLGWGTLSGGTFSYWDFNAHLLAPGNYHLIAAWKTVPTTTTTTMTTTTPSPETTESETPFVLDTTAVSSETLPTETTPSSTEGYTTTAALPSDTGNANTSNPASPLKTSSSNNKNNQKDSKKLPLYIIIAGGVLVLWALGLTIGLIVSRRRKGD